METFLAILVLMTLALVATSPRFYRMRRIPAVSVLMTGGWLAIAAGIAIGPEGVALIPRDALLNATPLLMMALGWIGFVIGLQARREVLANVIRDVGRLVAADVLTSLLIFGGVSWLLVWLWTDRTSLAWLAGPVGLLSAASLGWSMETRSLLRDRSSRSQHVALLLRAGGTLVSIFAIMWFGVLYDLPSRSADGALVLDWSQSASRFGITVVMSILMGLLGQLAFRHAGREREQQLVVSLGLVVFVAGLATELGASPMLASMLTGVVIANLSGKEFQRFERFIIEAEHVVAVLLALLAGLLMELNIGTWALVLALALVVLRVLAKPLIFRMGTPKLEQASGLEARQLDVAGPVRQNPLALAFAVGFVLAEGSQFNRQLLTVVIISGVVVDFVPVVLSLIPRFRQLPASTPTEEVA